MATVNLSFDDDIFGRREFAKNLMNIIDAWDTTTKESQSCVFSVDSPWGTGKTTFINMWKNMLSEEDYKQYAVAYYNAWENDDSEKPFFPLVYSLQQTVYTGTEEKVKNGLEAFAKKAGVAIFKDVIKKYIGEEVSSLVQLAIHGGLSGLDAIADIKVENYFKEHDKYLEIKKQFINALKDMIPENGKLIVFVDELDRCRPTFAIETLEIIKHYFDIENIVFVFAIDLEQLSHSIATMYGQNMDAAGYLRRFFDFNIKIPESDKQTYLGYILSDFSRFEGTDKFHKNAYKIVTKLNMSLRDINKVVNNFLIFANYYKDYLPTGTRTTGVTSVLEQDRQINCLSIYLYLIAVKYTYPKDYIKIIDGGFSMRTDNNAFLGNCHLGVLDCINQILNSLHKVDAERARLDTLEYRNLDLLNINNNATTDTFKTHFEKTIELFS